MSDPAVEGAVINHCAPQALGMTNKRYHRKGVVDKLERAKNKTKPSIRAKIEHLFLPIKRVFGFAKTRYRGLDQNAHRLFATCALTNLYIMRRRLMGAL